MYHDLNKAFVHLVFSPEELEKINPNAKKISNVGVHRPMMTYDSWFRNAGFNIEDTNQHLRTMEPFFKNNKLLHDRIIHNTAFHQIGFPDMQCSIEFVDYVLKPMS